MPGDPGQCFPYLLLLADRIGRQILQKTGHRIDGQGRANDDRQAGAQNCLPGIAVVLDRLFIQHHVWFENIATDGAVWDHLISEGVLSPAGHGPQDVDRIYL